MTDKRNVLRASLVSLLLVIATCLSAQQTPLRHYTMEDGLPSNTVYSITCDSKGFLWFATDKGIARFDGASFTSFNINNGLPDNDIFGILEDFSGRLWFTNFSGELCFLKEGIFYTEKNAPWLKLKNKAPIIRASIEKDSSITFILNDVPYFINIKGNRVQIIQSPKRERPILGIQKISPAVYLKRYPDLEIKADSGGKQLAVYYYKKNKEYYYSRATNSRDQGFFIALKRGIFSVNEELLYALPNIQISPVFSVPIKVWNKDLFIGLLGGLNINGSNNIEINRHVTSIENDVAGNIWFSTKGKGAYCLSKHFKDICEYRSVYTNQIVYGKAINGVPYFANDQGKLFSILKDKVVNAIPKLSAIDGKDIYLTKANFLVNTKGDFFRFYFGRYISFFKQKDRYRNGSQIENGELRLQRIIKDILYDGTYIFISDTRDITRIPYADFEKGIHLQEENVITFDDHKSARILSRCIDNRDGSLWYGVSGKVYKVSGLQSILQPQFGKHTFRQFHFINNYFIGYTEKNKLLIFNKYNTTNAIVDSIRSNNCIWENIYPIDETRVIVSTDNFHRLITLLPPTPDGRPDYKMQILENPFVPIQVDYIIADKKKCYFFKDGNITEVSTPILFEEEVPPIPMFSSLKAGKRNPAVTSAINLSYEEAKNIIISIDKVSFTSKNILTQYSISDHPEHDNWVTLNGRDINLNNLGFGDHFIKVRAKTLSTPFSKSKVLKIAVSYPFWATWWFIIAVVISLILIVWLAVVLLSRRRIRKQQKEHEADMKYQQSEYKALNALMNPHFVFNSLNNIQGLINKNDKRVANEYLVIFSDLIRQNMHNISKGFITLQEELTLVENYLNLEKLRFKEFITYSITVDEDVETDMILIPPLMIQPLVENAVKHGLLPKQSTENKVSIKVFERLDKLYIEIEDNGVGLTYASKHKSSHLHESFGLSNLQKRTDHLKKIQKQEISVNLHELIEEGGNVYGTKAVITMGLDISV